LLRLPPELLEELRGWAAQEMRSLNAQIEWTLREALRLRGREPRQSSDVAKRSKKSD
jgi:hypothetical protein